MLGQPAGAIAKLANVADDYLLVDRVVLRDGNKLRSIRDIFRLVGDVRSRKFDLVIDLHSLTETNLLGFAAGIHKRLYAHRNGRSMRLLSNFREQPPVEDRRLHAAERYMDVIRPLGITGGPKLSLESSGDDCAIARSIVEEYLGHKMVGMFLGAGHPSRRWPIERYGELANQLLEDKDVRCFVFLGPEEIGLVPDIPKLFPPDAIILDKLGLLQLFAVFSFLDVVIGNDTGPMHLAAATRAHLILILHESAPDEFLPLTDRLTVIRTGRIQEIEVSDVWTAVRARLDNDISGRTC